MNRMWKVNFYMTCSLLLLFGCGSIPSRPPSAPLSERISSTVVAAPVRELTYSGHSESTFEATISSSMRAKYSPIKVLFRAQPFAIEAPPVGLDRWLSAIRQSGGSILICPPESQQEGFIRELIPWIVEIGHIVLDAWVFRPAENYNAVAYESESPSLVDEVSFILRTSEPPC